MSGFLAAAIIIRTFTLLGLGMGELSTPLRILVVDDNVDAAELVAELVGMLGHDVSVAYGGAEAIATARRFFPNLIFLDIGMPGMDGYEVAATLRRAPWFLATRIVALTAWGDAVSRARAISCGFDGHLVKPALLESLIGETHLAMARH